MLLRILREIFAGRKTIGPATAAAAQVPERDRLLHRGRAHGAAPLQRHLEITLGELRVGDEGLSAFSDACLADSGSSIPPLKALHRPLASYFLSRYFTHALTLDGACVECGVFRGTTALFLCRAARARNPRYAGERLHLVDSFKGLSAPVSEDRVDRLDARDAAGQDGIAGTLSAPVEAARKALRDFPAAAIHEGWIPEVFAQLPETRWAFVHIDVDLYEPTGHCLEYFYPRLLSGGVIVCDDYGSPLFPGAQRAWNRFCERNNVPFVVLDTGQSVILKS